MSTKKKSSSSWYKRGGLNRKQFSFIGIFILIGIGTLLFAHAATISQTGNPANCQKAVGPFSIHGTKTYQANGKVYTPYGVSFSDLQVSNYNDFATTLHNQISAAAKTWCSNTVRIQAQQDLLVGSSGKSYSSNYMKAIETAVNYAKSLGLVVVINDQTEPLNGGYAKSEQQPTQGTLAFWDHIDAAYHNDPQVIYDVFNEPEPKPNTEKAAWQLWKNGGTFQDVKYLGMQAVVSHIRNNEHANNLLWVEGPRFADTLGDLSSYKLSGSGIVYSFHHPISSHTAKTWDADFGDVIKNNVAAVVDGEWTQYAPTDNQECWSDGYKATPTYLNYLAGKGVGLIVWTLRPGVMNTNNDFTTATTMNANYNCSHGSSQGAGQLIKNYFLKQNT